MVISYRDECHRKECEEHQYAIYEYHLIRKHGSFVSNLHFMQVRSSADVRDLSAPVFFHLLRYFYVP